MEPHLSRRAKDNPVPIFQPNKLDPVTPMELAHLMKLIEVLKEITETFGKKDTKSFTHEPELLYVWGLFPNMSCKSAKTLTQG